MGWCQPLRESALDFLVGPLDVQLIVQVGTLHQPRGKVNWYRQAHSVPVRLDEDAKLLRSAQRENRDQDLQTNARTHTKT